MEIAEIKEKIEEYKNEGKKMFSTSSLQTHSVVLLHILSKIDKSIPVYFINTGYLFPETITYKNKIADMFGLKIQDVRSKIPKSQQKDEHGRLLFTSDPDYCCYLNKVAPLEPILAEFDVWINGVRGDQNDVRSNFALEEQAPQNVTRFHPMLDWTNKDIQQYLKEHDIPRHPLEDKGYFSIGCEPCTRKFSLDMSEREARWFGLNKSECGLNTDLVHKN